ncbi:MAG: hypothetical protein AB1600_02900 [Bacteroidota bacterium]
MQDQSQRRVMKVSVAAALSALFFLACSSTASLPRYSKAHSPALAVRQLPYPDGWTEIADKTLAPSYELMLVNGDSSAVMVVRELQMDDSTRTALKKENACMAAWISLQLKLAERSDERRITRTPERINGNGIACSYVYDEKGLLRRVIVFHNKRGFFELELLPERLTDNFEQLTKDQFEVLNVLLR